MSNFKLFYLFFLILMIVPSFGNEMKCTPKFCEVYTTTNECPSIADACDEGKGEIFKAEVPCGCCISCIEYLGEDDYCSIGSPDTPPPTKMCGPRLSCQRYGEEYRCKKMKSTCFDKTLNKENKLTFVELSDCDADGNYGPVMCNVNQTCFCVDEKGERIFGEAIYDRWSTINMNCECSRTEKKLNDMKMFKFPGLFSRCLGDGSYDPLQCLDEKCICVERNSGSPVDKVSYNLTEIVYKDVPCYDRNLHMDWTYNHDCEEMQMTFMDEVHLTLAENIFPIPIEVDKCQPDGLFKSIIEDGDLKVCVNKYKKPIKDYSAKKDSEEAKNMNCKCARTQDLLYKNKKDVPECCPNGNFKKIQCQEVDESQKMCYCVDENGLQTEKEELEADISKLSCYKDKDKC